MGTIKGCLGHIDSVISMKMKMCNLKTDTGRCIITKAHPDFNQMIEKIGASFVAHVGLGTCLSHLCFLFLL